MKSFSSTTLAQISFWVLILICSPFNQEVKLLVNHVPPFIIINGEEVSGPVYDSAVKILDESKLNYSVEILPHARLYQTAKTVPNTIACAISQTEERKDDFIWLTKIHQSIEAVLYKKKGNDNIKIETIQDLKNHKLGLVRNDLYHTKFKKNKSFVKGQNLFLAATTTENIKMLLKGRIDISIFESNMLKSHTSQMQIDLNDLEPILVLNKFDPYLAMNKNSDSSLIQTLKNVISK